MARQVSDDLVEQLGLGEALHIALAGIVDREHWRAFLRGIVERHRDEFGAEETELLAQALVQHDAQSYEFPDLPLTGIAASHPESALAGVRSAGEVSAPVVWTQLFFLRDLPPDLLASQLTGPEGRAFEGLLAQIQREAIPEPIPLDASLPPDFVLDDEQEDPRYESPSRRLARLIEDGSISEVAIPDTLAWPLDEFDDSQRARLTELVKAWWPNKPLSTVIQVADNGDVTANNGAMAAVAAAAALDLDLDRDRWLDLFATPGAMSLIREVVPWLARTYRPNVDQDAARIIRGADSEWHVYYAVSAVPAISDQLAEAVIDQLSLVSDPHRLHEVIRAILTPSRTSLLRRFLESGPTSEQQQVAREELARNGDVDAQLQLLESTVEQVRGGNRHAPGLTWAEAVADDRVVERLGSLLELTGPAGDIRDELVMSAISGMAASRSATALRVYDRLIAEGDSDAAFFYYPREGLARQMATEAALARLPSDLGELVHHVEHLDMRPGI